MIVKKIKDLLNEFRTRDENLKNQNDDLMWANVFHDTIKDKEWLKNLSISPGRFAAGYSFLYVLVRALSDYKPKRILEFGLGESSKIVSAFLDNELEDSHQLIFEQDETWLNVFNSRFTLSQKTQVLFLPLIEKNVKGVAVYCYSGIEEKVNGIYDLYIVDGPLGSPHFSRYDLIAVAEKIKSGDDFIIIIDDYNRNGEIEMISDLQHQFKLKGIKISTAVLRGCKSVFIIATEKYWPITSI